MGASWLGGLGRYHTIGLLVPLAVALSGGGFWRQLIPGTTAPLVAGPVIAAAVSLALFTYVPALAEPNALQQALLLGALLLEMTALHTYVGVPPMKAISLSVFLYTLSVEK
jgi:hypothetical protein